MVGACASSTSLQTADFVLDVMQLDGRREAANEDAAPWQCQTVDIAFKELTRQLHSEMPSVQRSTLAPVDVHIVRLALDINSTRPATRNDRDHAPDLADVMDYEDASRDDDTSGRGALETTTMKGMHKIMPKAARVGAKLAAVAGLQENVCKRQDEAIAEMNAACAV